MNLSPRLPILLVAAVTCAVSACLAGGAEDSGAGGGAGASYTAGGTGGKAGGSTGAGTGGSGAGHLVEPGGDGGRSSGAGGGGGGPADGGGGAGGAGGGAGGGDSGGDSGAGGGGGGPPPLICSDPGVARKFYMSADDSSSMGSATVAREYLRAGEAPPPALIRTYELLNYYRVRFPLPKNDKLGIHVAFAPRDDGSYRFQVAVQAFEVIRPPLSITFVVDTSGSLVGEGIARERAAIKAIAGRLRPGDRVNLVTWANEESELLKEYEVSGPDDPTLPLLAEKIAPSGGSDLHAGLTHGYALAKLTYGEKRLNRLVLISDGGANLGILDRDLIAKEAEDGDAAGIHLVGVGLGPALGYSDTLMNAVTDAGRGSYVYLDSAGEAEAVLGERFEEVMDIAARNVEIAVTMPSYFDIATSSGEGISLDKSAIDPQTIAPGDSMVLDQVLTLLPEGKLCDHDSVVVDLTWNDPLLPISEGANFTSWSGTLLDVTGEPWQLLKAEAIFAYGRALQSRSTADFTLAEKAIAKAMAHPDLAAEDPYSAELNEIQELLAKFPPGEKL